MLQFPASIFVKRLQFHRFIPAITFGWGVTCMCLGFVNGPASLFALRLLLGLFEGCLFPAMTLVSAQFDLCMNSC
jgi:MFS family permease